MLGDGLGMLGPCLWAGYILIIRRTFQAGMNNWWAFAVTVASWTWKGRLPPPHTRRQMASCKLFAVFTAAENVIISFFHSLCTTSLTIAHGFIWLPCVFCCCCRCWTVCACFDDGTFFCIWPTAYVPLSWQSCGFFRATSLEDWAWRNIMKAVRWTSLGSRTSCIINRIFVSGNWINFKIVLRIR